jgi:hypothetical protein
LVDSGKSKDEEDKKATATDSGAPAGYQFFVDDSSSLQYSFGLNAPLPDPAVNNFASLLQQGASVPAGSQSGTPANIVQNVSVVQNVQFAHQTDILENAAYGKQEVVAENVQYGKSAVIADDAVVDNNHSHDGPNPDTIDDQGWPALTKRERLASGSVQPLNLHLDSRYAGHPLDASVRSVVDRVYGLVDLDFSGFVDFKEMTAVLDTDHLSDSEKKLVKIIYAVGRKALSEKPAPPAGVSPVMNLEDFRHAFAFQSAQARQTSKPALKVQAGGKQLVELKPTVYADLDYPLLSVKPAAVRVGTMGDAYFSAVIGAIAELRPRTILRVIREKPDHSFNVAFPAEPGKPLEIMQPRPEEMLRYGLVSKFGFWYPLLEKAYGIHQAKQHRLASAIGDKRNDTLRRASQAIDAMTGRSTGTLVVANCNEVQLMEHLSSFMQRQRVVIAVAADTISEGSSYSGAAPLPNKPYPVAKLDLDNNKIVLNSVYGETHEEEDFVPLSLTASQFLHLFKVLYFEEDAGSGSKLNNLLKATVKQGSTSWKKLG